MVKLKKIINDKLQNIKNQISNTRANNLTVGNKSNANIKNPIVKTQPVNKQQSNTKVSDSIAQSLSEHTNGPELLPMSGYEPPYEPDVWNNSRVFQDTHNCYDYSINNKAIQTEKRQPNNIQIPTGPYNCYDMERAIKADIPNLRIVGNYEKCPAQYSKIMLLTTRDGADYHFLRQDNDGLWSHKVGDSPVHRTDTNGKIITNPQHIKLVNEIGDYANQCAMYCIPSK